MSFWSRFFGPNMPSLPQDGPILVIDYSASIQKLGLLSHGTVFLEGEKAGVIWSTTIMGQRKSHTLEITPLLFRTFWRVMDRLPEFRKSWVSNSNEEPDPTKHNFVAMVMQPENTVPVFQRRHAIKLDDASEELRDLLMLVGLGSCK